MTAEILTTAPQTDLGGADKSKAELFAEKMMGVINGAALAVMTSVGHRTRLFDVMAGLAPATCVEIARVAGLNERYVREWLGAMVTGRVVEYDAADGTYLLPAEHAAFLTRGAALNLAVSAQFVPLLASVETQIVECFRRGGGVPYEAFDRFHEMMAEESAQTVVAALEDAILPLAPGLTDELSRGIDVLDVGCGSGRGLNFMAERYPNSRLTGYDFAPEAIKVARAQAAGQKLGNVRFAVRDVAMLGEQDNYDLITAFDAIHDQAHPAAVLRGIYDALRPGGTFLMQDIRGSSRLEKNLAHPIAPYLYAVSCMHCMTVSLACGGDGLGTMWGEEKALEMLGDAGFTGVEVKRLPHDIMNNFYVARKREG